MSMFPGAGAQIYRNEAGEVLGWDYPSQDDPYEPDEWDDAHTPDPEDEEDEPVTVSRHIEITNCYELHETVVTRVWVELQPRENFQDDEAWDEHVYEVIYPLTGVGHEDGNSTYFAESIDGLEPIIDEQFG